MIALKENQGGLYEQVADFMEKQHSALAVHKSLDKAHGRVEERNVYVTQQDYPQGFRLHPRQPKI